MKILTVCSSPYVSLKPITALFDKAGLSKALESGKDGQSYEQLHEKIFAAYENESSGLTIKKAITPGKVWQDMAGQLILDNLDQNQWYWSASKAGWLLDFWHQMESQHRFVLVYSPPQLGISQCLLNIPEKQAELDMLVESWINYHVEMLRFYREHQNKCILVNYQRCLEHPYEFIQACKEYLSFSFNNGALFESGLILNSEQNIEASLFEPVKEKYPEINFLFQELEASATSFSLQEKSFSSGGSHDKTDPTIIWKSYHYLKKQHANNIEIKNKLESDLKNVRDKLKSQEQFNSQSIEKNKILSEKNSDLKSENELTLLQLHQTQEEINSQNVEKNKDLSEKNSELESENELMLLQLHQVQEELEHYFLKYQEVESAAKSKKTVVFLEQEEDLSISAQLIEADDKSNRLTVNLINLQWQEQSWSQYTLQLVHSDEMNGHVTLSLIRLPEQKNKLLPLKTWPPQTADESGAYWEIDTNLLETETVNSSFYPEDIAFLHGLLEQLPLWLKTLEGNDRLRHNDWLAYYQVIDELKAAIDPVYELQHELSE